MTLSSLVVGPTSGEVVHALGQDLIVQLNSEETGGQLTLGTLVVPPRSGAPIHFHRHEDEYFVVLAGRVEFFREGAWAEVPVGLVLYLPRGSTHGFRNAGSEELRMLVQAVPGGFERFFRGCAEVFAQHGAPDTERITEISAEHGIHYPEQ